MKMQFFWEMKTGILYMITQKDHSINIKKVEYFRNS